MNIITKTSSIRFSNFCQTRERMENKSCRFAEIFQQKQLSSFPTNNECFIASNEKKIVNEPVSSSPKIIALAGISGIGKSTMAKELAVSCKIDYVLEEEEAFWPEIIREYKKHNPFDVMMAFRQLWLVSHLKAAAIRSEGKDCILDTIFIKILHYELGKPGIQWLFPSTNPYADILFSLTKKDVSLLPDPDSIVLMDCSFEDWKSLLTSRRRNLDLDEGFLSSFEESKKMVENAVLQLGSERNIPIVRFKVIFGDIPSQVLRLKLQLQQDNLLKDS